MTTHSTIRHRTYRLLDGEGVTPLNRTFNAFLILLIVANVLAIIFESDQSISATYALGFYLFEIFSVFVFTIEYIARLWSCVETKKYHVYPFHVARLKYFFTPLAIIDLLAVAPFYLSLFFAIDLRYLRMLRMLRLLKLSHYFKGLNVFLSVLTKEIATIASAIFIVAILVILSASMMYTLEREAQPEVFGSIPHSIWWAVVTMTTVGYGDVTPITFGGRILAGFIMLLGVGIVALPAGMLAARFGEELKSRKDQMHIHVTHALQDGIVDDLEWSELKKTAKELDLSMDTLERLVELQIARRDIKKICPHCGKSIIDDEKK